MQNTPGNCERKLHNIGFRFAAHALLESEQIAQRGGQPVACRLDLVRGSLTALLDALFECGLAALSQLHLMCALEFGQLSAIKRGLLRRAALLCNRAELRL